MFARSLPRWLVPAAVVLLLATLLTWLVWPSGRPQAVHRPGFVLSYAGAGEWLAGLGDAEADEQLRDWARFGLAADLELGTTELVDGLYDTLPVRDGGFTDLARQQVGPGRSLFAGNVLNLLVPRGDPHENRTIALLLDQHRTDAGRDPERVRLHHYTNRAVSQSVAIESGTPVDTGEFRRAHGYVRARIDGSDGLTRFLAETRALSTVERSGDEIWAGGWRWSDDDGPRLSREDVAVLQRGYGTGGDPTPGFSLDPGPMETIDDLTTIVPGLDPEVLDGVAYDDWAGSKFGSTDEFVDAAEDAVFGEITDAETTALGLPTDRTQLWALLAHVDGQSPYGQARYDGDLRGTTVGMTLFYTDYVAKDWVNGVGTGVPAEAVEGFETDPGATTPWGHCDDVTDPGNESGRLWFGPNEAAYSYQDDRISMGAQSTRLFARSDGAAGAEVESSYSFGRGLSWWDVHYQAVVDYEDEYGRLDQIMRWSSALEWLGADAGKLPTYTDVTIRDDLRFADWYRDNDDLRERASIPFVSPPSATDEAVLTVPSETYDDCGLNNVHGGVSLSDLGARKAEAGRTFEADLPDPVRRAGFHDEKSSFDRAEGTGEIKQVSIDETGAESSFVSRRFSRPADGTTRVETTASPRTVVPMGTLKVWGDKATPRAADIELRGGEGRISQQAGYQGHDLGGLTAVKQGDVVTLSWRRGLVDHMRNAVESVQNRLSSGRAGTPVDGTLYSMRDTGGHVLYRLGDEGDPWLGITRDAPRGPGLTLRLGVAGQEGPRFSYGTLVANPVFPPGAWLKVTPAKADAGANAVPAGGPPTGTPGVRVTTQDGRVSALYPHGDDVWVPSDDPVLGRGGTVEGAALLRDYRRVGAALEEARTADDGLLRGVVLGSDGVALVGTDGIRLSGAGDLWAHEVSRVVTKGRSRPPLFALVDGHLLNQAEVPLRTKPGTEQDLEFGDVIDGKAVVLISDDLRATLPAGPVLADALPRDREVTVVEATVSRDEFAGGPVTQPDIWRRGDDEWWRVADGGGGSGSGGAAGGAGAGNGGSIDVVLVCDEDDEDEDCAA